MSSKMGSNGRTFKILLVDDEPQNIRELFETLNSNLYRIFIAVNGESAVEQTIKHVPDAIIMDWDMPIMNGLDAIKLIRSNEIVKNIPIIVATGKMTTIENLRTALQSGANDYIRKPFDPIEVEARVQSMIKYHMEVKKVFRLENEVMQKKIEMLNHEIEINKQALSVSKIRLINNSNKNNVFINELEELNNFTNENGKSKIAKLISELKVNSSIIKNEEFEEHFERVHPSFFKILHQSFPELTNNDIELCTFIKLEMTSREIIAITSKTDNALKKSRQRLRKKLGLRAEDSLGNFIHEIG